MNWAFIIWALTHIALSGSPMNLVIASGILVLTLFGSLLQDKKKEALLGDAWQGGKLHLPLIVRLNDTPFGQANAGVDMTFNFPQLICHAAKSRPLAAGAIIGSGTVSNKRDGEPGLKIEDGGDGYSCLAEIRMIETIANGAPSTPFMAAGDRVEIEMMDADGASIFGRIDQRVKLV